MPISPRRPRPKGCYCTLIETWSWAFIGEFAAGGELLTGLSVDDRRERIRVAIYTQKLAHMPFRDGPMNYAEAYAECFGRPLRTLRRAA